MPKETTPLSHPGTPDKAAPNPPGSGGAPQGGDDAGQNFMGGERVGSFLGWGEHRDPMANPETRDEAPAEPESTPDGEAPGAVLTEEEIAAGAPPQEEEAAGPEGGDAETAQPAETGEESGEGDEGTPPAPTTKEDTLSQILNATGTSPSAEAITQAARKALSGDNGEDANGWQEFLSSHVEMVDGKPQLRVEAAARTLQAAGQDKDAIPALFQETKVNERAVRQAVEEELLAPLKDGMDADDVANWRERMGPTLKKMTADRVKAIKGDLDRQRDAYLGKVAQTQHQFFSKKPEAKELMGEMSRFLFDGLPEEISNAILLADPGVLERVYEAVHLKSNLENILSDVWDKATKAAKEEAVPTDAGGPQHAGRGRRRKPVTQGPDADVKEAILNASTRNVMGQLVGDR